MGEKKRYLEELRAKAERVMTEDSSISSHPARADLEYLIEELDVHRIELEIQNEELRHRQLELEESRSRYLELYEFAPVAFLTVLPKYPHRIVGANAMASALLGVVRTKQVGMPFMEFAPEEAISTLKDFFGGMNELGRHRSAEVRIRRKSSPSPHFFSARIQAVRVKGGEGKDRILVSLSDITDLQKAKQELQRANQALIEKNRELKDFAFVASHDLREPIRKVLTFGSLLEEQNRDRLDERSLDYIKRMNLASSRMDRLLASLLVYSRLSTRTNPFQKVDLNATLAQVTANLADEIERRSARLNISNLQVIEAEPQHMEQLLQNLLSNALKYSERRPEISVYAEDGRNHCTIYVVDNGIGFEQKYLDKIFAPFQRLHGRDKYDGTGMGLTICRKIVERHKGHITATSRPGEGSMFIVTLPVSQDPNEQE